MKFKEILDYKYTPQILTLSLVIMSFIAYRYFAYHDTYSSDSYVSANIINMATIVKGPVTRIHIQDNQQVKKGQKLITIEPKPYLYALEEAKAQLALAKKNYANDLLMIKVNKEKLNQAQLSLALYQDHLKRYQKLVDTKAIPEVKLIDVTASLREQEAAVSAAQLNLNIAEKNLDDSPIKQAQAKLDDAKYLYDNTTLYAPIDGVVTNFNLRVGQTVTAHQGLFALIETDKWWVVTRYRETELRLIKPGDKARITLDMYPGKSFEGHVESISWGINRVQSGSVAPSTLSYLEATEDWIKIAQRFPVRIVFDKLDSTYPLRIGASATTKTYPNAN